MFINSQEDRGALQRDKHAGFLARVGLTAMFAVLISLILSQFSGWAAAIGIGGSILGAGVAVGGFLGFLFSVPRILTKEAAGDEGRQAKPVKSEDPRRARLLASNTNLERISEWLTTMLVGVGLSQLTLLGAKFQMFADFLASHAKVFGTGSTSHAGALPVVGPFLLIFGIVSGFVFLYLYTRIYLSPLFQHVEEVFGERGEPGQELLKVGQPEVQEAAAQLAQASESPSMTYAAGAASLSVNESLDVIFNLLYEKDGYEKAIAIGNTIAGTSAAKLPKYWFLMCAALGQKHHQLKLKGSSADDLRTIRNAVLDAARQAVRLDPKYKKRLTMLLDPNGRDNDLQDFADDVDMRRILSLNP